MPQMSLIIHGKFSGLQLPRDSDAITIADTLEPGGMTTPQTELSQLPVSHRLRDYRQGGHLPGKPG